MSESVHPIGVYMHQKFLLSIITGLGILILSFTTRTAYASEIVFSPDKKISLVISIQEKSSPYPEEERLYYSIYYREKEIVKDSPLGLIFFNTPPIGKDLRLYNVQRKRIKGSFVPLSGKADTSYVEYNQILLYLQEKRPPFRFFTVEFILSNYGTAFRYHLPSQQGLSVSDIKQEETGFYLAGDYSIILPVLPDLKRPEIYEYSVLPVSQIKDTLSLLPPVLLQADKTTWLEITETNLKDSHSMKLISTPHIRYSFNITPDTLYSGSKNTSSSTAWRIILIGENPGQFAYSSFLYLLNKPRAVTDVSWIKSGTYINFRGGTDTDSLVNTINFCKENKIDYIAIPMETKPDTEQIKHIVSLAKGKNINIILNTPQSYLGENCIEKIVDFKEWGVSGLFVNISSEQKTDNLPHASEILENALSNKLIVGITGQGNLSGLAGTYPNFLTFIPNLKYLPQQAKENISLVLTTIPYTDMISSPVDLCAVYYDNLNSSEACDMSYVLALHVLTNSSLRMWNNLCVAPNMSHFTNFLATLPPSWDQTIFIDGKPGEFIILARRTGLIWYVSAISNSYRGTLNISLSFLQSTEKQYEAAIYFKNPSNRKGKGPAIITKHIAIKPSETFDINLTPKSGYTAVIKQINR